MYLPDYILRCIQRLEAAGFAAYAVGGCVRDACLGLEPQDYDLCTSATPAQLKQLFRDRELVLSGEKHGTVAVVTESGLVEITTFRQEGEYHDNRHPDWVAFVDSVEADLARRDFTVNAMAYSPTRGFADPFGGRSDLENGVLRAVGNPEQRFREDSLRILRGVRFAVRFRLTPEKNTVRAMASLAPLMDNLARERVFAELCKLLPLVTAQDLLTFAPVLGAVIPELGAMVGFDQHSPHHAYDVYTHTAQVVAAMPQELTLRWAALLHDVGKVPAFTRDETGRGHFYGHGPLGAKMADEILHRLKAPTALREQVVLLISQHMTLLEPDRHILRRRLSRLGPETVRQLLTLQRGDFGGKGILDPVERSQFDRVEEMIREILAENACLTVRDLAINGHDLMALGYQGREIGRMLEALLNQVLEDRLPNTREALLRKAGEKPVP